MSPATATRARTLLGEQRHRHDSTTLQLRRKSLVRIRPSDVSHCDGPSVPSQALLNECDHERRTRRRQRVGASSRRPDRAEHSEPAVTMHATAAHCPTRSRCADLRPNKNHFDGVISAVIANAGPRCHRLRRLRSRCADAGHGRVCSDDEDASVIGRRDPLVVRRPTPERTPNAAAAMPNGTRMTARTRTTTAIGRASERTFTPGSPLAVR